MIRIHGEMSEYIFLTFHSYIHIFNVPTYIPTYMNTYTHMYIYIYNMCVRVYVHFIYIYMHFIDMQPQKTLDWLTTPSLCVISQRGGWWQKLMDRRRSSGAATVCSIKWGILPIMMGINNLGKLRF